MEEILASIRKIISEDSTESQPATVASAAHAEADVLELTQEVHEEPPAPPPPPVAAPVPAPEPARAAAPEPAAAPKSENDVIFQAIEEVPVSPEAQSPHSHEGIFSEKTRKALEDSFASIQPAKAEAQPDAVPHLPSLDGPTVQAVFERAVRETFDPVLHNWLDANADAVVERLKPIVREWMDEHFPALLEGAVRAEVERVARARH
jgi:cell pole-organizing protein PopZ